VTKREVLTRRKKKKKKTKSTGRNKKKRKKEMPKVPTSLNYKFISRITVDANPLLKEAKNARYVKFVMFKYDGGRMN